MTILPLTYLGSTEWFAHLLNGDCIVDVDENWVKQTARNRCEILTSVGVAALTVPVHGYGGKIAARDVRIDNSKRWQHQHWVSLVSAYRNSPFFNHYEERFAPFYERRFDFLVDLNLELTETILCALDAGNVLKISENYISAAPCDIDLRGKKALRRQPGPAFMSDKPTDGGPQVGRRPGRIEPAEVTDQPLRPGMQLKYTQVFSDRMDFVAGLSVIDLLFCESGPTARRMLIRWCRH